MFATIFLVSQVTASIGRRPYLTSDDTCPYYNCDTSNLLTQGQCAIQFSSNSTGYFQPCSSLTQKCNFVSGVQGTSLCKDFVDAGRYFAGSYCNSNSTCPITPSNSTSQFCKNNVCQGQNLGETCSFTYQCNPGYYCSSANACTDQLDIGEVCTSDEQCSNLSSCIYNNITNTKAVCTQARSIKTGEYFALLVSEPSMVGGYDLNESCESLIAYHNTSSIVMCIDPPKSDNQGPCTVNANCTATIPNQNFTTFTQCECLNNEFNSTQKQCALAPGDNEYQGYLYGLSQFATSNAASKCNNENKWGDSCYLLQGMDLYEEFVYNRTKALYTNQIAKVNECVTATLYPLYYQYEKDHDNDNDHHSDNAAHLGLLGILIWLF